MIDSFPLEHLQHNNLFYYFLSHRLGGSSTTTSFDLPPEQSNMTKKASIAAKNTRGQPAEILPRMWVGSLASLKYLSTHERKSWTVISILGSDKLVSLCDVLMQEIKTSRQCRRHVVWKLADKSDSIFFSDEMIELLYLMDETLRSEEAPGNEDILVHCAMGASRSVTLCAAWIMSRRRQSLQDTMEMIRKVRPQAFPNMGFIASLRALETCDFDVKKARRRLGQEGDQSAGNNVGDEILLKKPDRQ